MGRVITAPGVLTNVQGQIDHVTDMYDDIKNNNLKPLTITLDPVSNANGAVSVVTEDPRVTEDMKPISIEVGTPEVFKAPITVTTAAGTVTLACESASGTSTVKITLVKTSPVEGGEDYPPAVTSTEFDILADRIGSLGELETTDQSSIVNAVNEVVDDIEEVNSNLANAVYDADCNNMTNANICYYADGNTANKPTEISSWLLIRVIGKAGGFITQIASEENVLNGRVWYRTKTSSTWGDWHELALNSKVNRIGSYETTQYDTKSVSNEVVTLLTELQPPSGYWLIIANITYNSNENGTRAASLSMNNDLDSAWWVSVRASNYGSSALQVVRFQVFNGSESIKLLGRQTSGSALGAAYRVFAIKLHDL